MTNKEFQKVFDTKLNINIDSDKIPKILLNQYYKMLDEFINHASSKISVGSFEDYNDFLFYSMAFTELKRIRNEATTNIIFDDSLLYVFVFSSKYFFLFSEDDKFENLIQILYRLVFNEYRSYFVAQ